MLRAVSRRAAMLRSNVFPPKDCATSSGAADTASLALAMVRLGAERVWRADRKRTKPSFAGGLVTLSLLRLRARAQRVQRLSKTGLHIQEASKGRESKQDNQALRMRWRSSGLSNFRKP